MVTTVADLIVARTADEITAEQLAALVTEGFPADSWQSGSVPRSLVKANATAMAVMDGNVADLAKAAFLDDAEGDWLTLFAASRYDVTRVAATYTVGRVTLTVASGSGPHTISAAQLLVTDGVRRWRSTNTAAVEATSAATLSIEVRAEASGAAYNVAAGTTPTAIIHTVVAPAVAGLTVDNPVYASGTWVTTAGADEESDASVRDRCRARWGTLGRGANLAAYEYWATSSPDATTVTRANVVPGAGDGTLTIYVAQATSVASGGQVSTVQTYVNTQKPVTDTPTVTAATAVSVAVTGTVQFSSATYDTTAAHTAITDALTAYIVAKGFGEAVDLGGLYHAIYGATEGVLDVDLSAPSVDTTLTASQIGAAGTFTLTYSS